MRPIATNKVDKVAWSVSLFVCVLDTPVGSAETAEPIEMPFGIRVALLKGPCSERGAHRSHLTNKINQSMRQRRCGLSLPLL